ncbi:hypothetical protein [Acinetobacter phage P577]|uniref:hypothetical protein n=1 Tax=Acinetobacter phage YMC13/03/R2096 TaxID=1560342 RepID=UPI00052AFA2A|nr:hypothetical protein ACQ36_gp016 [Acinetobacter phage YMC13/03/R2096]AIW02750.1 hypothetical protein BPABA577_00160 [Acinetobacter phage YMC13/03/R2096]WNT46240.1 hypothetical protein [Acinetobacter phage P577]
MAKGYRNPVAKNLHKFNQPKTFRDKKKDVKLGYDEGIVRQDLEEALDDQESCEEKDERRGTKT